MQILFNFLKFLGEMWYMLMCGIVLNAV